MAEKTLEELLISGDIPIVQYCCQKVEGQYERAIAKNANYTWIIEFQKYLWTGIRDAHKNGKKRIFFGGPVPVEIIAAFDCLPVYLDTIPIRLSPSPTLAGRFVDASEKYVGSSMCAFDKTELGMILLNQFGVEPDAFVYASVPCDSSRIAYPNMEKIMNVPTFSFDTPYRRDERGLQYLVNQTKQFIAFMEEFTGQKFEWEKLKPFMENANRTFELQGKCADLRKKKPCPLPGRMLVLNGVTNGMPCYPETAAMLQQEYEIGEMMISLDMGPCPSGEKHRIVLLQNMIWSCAGIMDWLEQEYNSVIVMDAFGFQHGDLFPDNLDDKEACFKVMARKMQNNPMIHGASGPTKHYIDLVDDIFIDYQPDISFFLGHVGCKHTWASSKMITDVVQEKYGMPTLFIDLDGVDGRYKQQSETKSQIKEYMDTVINK